MNSQILQGLSDILNDMESQENSKDSIETTQEVASCAKYIVVKVSSPEPQIQRITKFIESPMNISASTADSDSDSYGNCSLFDNYLQKTQNRK